MPGGAAQLFDRIYRHRRRMDTIYRPARTFLARPRPRCCGGGTGAARSRSRPKTNPPAQQRTGSAAAIRTAGLAFIFGLVTSVAGAIPVSAQDDSKLLSEGTTPPMPPARPSTLTPAQQALTPAAPPQSPAAPQATENNSTSDEGPGQLLQLPPYSRARMHECALEWQKMKATGAAADKIWFNFARTCLVR